MSYSKILVLGPTGNVGSKLIPELLKSGKTVVAYSRHPEKLADLQAQGVEVVKGDMLDEATLTEAMKVVDAAFIMVAPIYSGNMLEFYKDSAVVYKNAIKASGLKNVVILSSVGADIQDSGVVEGLYWLEKEMNSLTDVNVKVLRPSYFMENLYGQIALLKHQNILGSPIKGDLSMAAIATQDIAHAAAKYFNEGFTGHSVQYLLGKSDVTMNHIANVIAKELGKESIPYIAFPYPDAEKAMLEWGFSQDAASRMVRMQEQMNNGVITTAHLRDDYSTTATSIEDFAKSWAAAYQNS